jgi:C1A family cysteine protease
MPQPDENNLHAEHAVVAVGYADSQKRSIVRNSWGTDCGMKGYFTMPYDYLTNDNLANYFWTIRRGKGF